MPNLRPPAIALAALAFLCFSKMASGSPVSFSRFKLPGSSQPKTLTVIGDRHAPRDEKPFTDLILRYLDATSVKGIPTLLLTEIRPAEASVGFATSLIPQLHNHARSDKNRTYAYLACDPRPGGRREWSAYIEYASDVVEALGENSGIPTQAQKEKLREVEGRIATNLARLEKLAKGGLPGVTTMEAVFLGTDRFLQETLPQAIKVFQQDQGATVALGPLTSLLEALEGQGKTMKGHWTTFLGPDSGFAQSPHVVALLEQLQALAAALGQCDDADAGKAGKDQVAAAIAFAKGWDPFFNNYVEAAFLVQILDSLQRYDSIVLVAGDYHERILANRLKVLFGTGSLQKEEITLGCSTYSLGMGLDLDVPFKASQLEALLCPQPQSAGSAAEESKTVLASAPKGERCAKCGTPGNGEALKLKNCGRCRKVLYCSAECQKAHWKSQHQAECMAKR